MEYSLVLTFLTKSGEKVNLTIADVRNDLTNEEISAAVVVILRENILLTKKGDDLVAFHSAKLNEKRSTLYDIQVDL
ncbi:DUF2922 domain-containing protein [Clostridium intestinale]|uniref:DUF2922 family protein n=1 Tax=Clostridium intestinale DSM 6191 TaxID=1121320 RepID=A0A1M6FHD2_9CLOT|nr:DUF2922 domain-containing protein [Clostridium intestinale]SHI97134.1 Protein of unknown function [Clostridium intestinale DSM 6191]